MTATIVSLRPFQEEAENERISAIGMKLASAIAKAVVEDEPIDTASLLHEVERMGQSVGLGPAKEALAIAWSTQAEIIADFMRTAAEELHAAGVFGVYQELEGER
jgi:hypothetical protein